MLNYEPPHPFFQMKVSEAAAHPERAHASNFRADDYDVSIYPDKAPCTLVVKSAEGVVLGRSSGTWCHVALTGETGQSWTFEATSSAADAEIQLARSNPLFPRPLGHVAVGGAVLLALGVLCSLLSLLSRGG